MKCSMCHYMSFRKLGKRLLLHCTFVETVDYRSKGEKYNFGMQEGYVHVGAINILNVRPAR